MSDVSVPKSLSVNAKALLAASRSSSFIVHRTDLKKKKKKKLELSSCFRLFHVVTIFMLLFTSITSGSFPAMWADDVPIS